MVRSQNSIAVACVLIWLNTSSVSTAEKSSDEWLRGSGEDLQLCLQGEVVDSDGQPASGLQLVTNLNATIADRPVQASVEGHRFRLWIPVNQPHWYSLWLRASSSDNGQVAYAKFNAHQLRQAAIDGIKLTLQSPTRHVYVRVLSDGQPVAGATVKAELGFGIALRSNTGANGFARLALLPEQELSQLTAWTDDHRVGGFGFSRSPPRDPEAANQVIELSKCRDQKLRFVTEEGSPVSGLGFVLQIATPSPNYNYIGLTDHSELMTDAAGEAVYEWFPDWDDLHFYADIDKSKWVLVGEPKMVDGVATFRVKQRSSRKRVNGHVVSKETGIGAGGFYVSLWSFQGEREGHGDVDTAFTNPDGTFTVDVLPDATYCAYVLDERWVGKIIDILPYESAGDKLAPLELTVADGQPVEVTVTSGPPKKPVANLIVSFRRYHQYSWFENGKERSGSSGPQWWATTDQSGKATTRTLPGKLEVSIYSPRWRAEESMEVVADKPARITLHRAIDEEHTVTGQIVLDPEVATRLEEVEVRVYSMDSNYQDEQSLKCTAEGGFSFDTLASELGIFATTPDGKAAGSIVTNELGSPIQVLLRPTGEYQGQLFTVGDQPAVNHLVSAYIRLKGTRAGNARLGKVADVKRIETETDEHGNYTIQGLPLHTKLMILADAIDGSNDSVYIDEVYLEPNESRPRSVKSLSRTLGAAEQVPIAKRYPVTLRDCALGGFRPLIIIADDSEGAMRFVDQNYANYELNKDVYPFMQIIMTSGKIPLDPADEEFLKGRQWPLPQPGHVFALALDSDGRELGRQDLILENEGAARDAANFIHEHAPAPQDAEEKWTTAFAEAERTNRSVWARVSQRYCGPCFRMTRWLDDQRALLEKDYVMLKIDDVRDINGKDVAQRIVRGQQVGIPFHAIFDASASLLIDSKGPLGNIGSPGGTEGKKHLRTMLTKTRRNLTDAEIDLLVESASE